MIRDFSGLRSPATRVCVGQEVAETILGNRKG